MIANLRGVSIDASPARFSVLRVGTGVICGDIEVVLLTNPTADNSPMINNVPIMIAITVDLTVIGPEFEARPLMEDSLFCNV